MTDDISMRIRSKCLKIYSRKKTLRPVYTFVERLNLADTEHAGIMEEVILPEIRKQYFPDLAIEALLQEFIELYRGTSNHVSVLIDVWDRIDTQLPLTSEEYEELVERFCALLEDEPEPPSKADWDNLDEWLMK